MKETFPPQHQNFQPGFEFAMEPRPISEDSEYKGADKLKNKVAVISGGDSGIGRAVAYAFAKEGSDIVILYLNEEFDAEETRKRVEEIGRRCHLISGDVRDQWFCQESVQHVMDEFGHIDILVNNSAVQFPQAEFGNITEAQLAKTFDTNIFGYFLLTQAVLPCLKAGSAIINTSSITAYQGSPHLIDYSSTKGAIISFTRSLAINLIPRQIRVNAVAPGEVWTPLIPASFSEETVENFGKDNPMGRAAQPFEIAPAYVFLASEKDSGFITGQTIHVNGGEFIET